MLTYSWSHNWLETELEFELRESDTEAELKSLIVTYL